MDIRRRSDFLHFVSRWGVCAAFAAIIPNLLWSAEPAGQPGRKHAASLIVVNVDGSDPIDVSNREMSYFGSPQWSRDGRRVAYDAWKGSGGGYRYSHIFVCNADGSDVVDLGRGAMPSWSPDGTQVVGHTYESPAAGIWLMSTDGRQRRQLTTRAWSPSWSPVAETIACQTVAETVAHQTGGSIISLIDVKTGESRQLLEDGWHPGLGFTWSPDGRHIAFRKPAENAPGKRYELAIANLDPDEPTGDVRSLAQFNEMFSGVAWSPDGRQISFSAQRDSDDKPQMYTINVDGDTKPERIPWQDPQRRNSSACWSPDGKRLVYLSEE